MVKASIKFTEDFLLESQERYRRQCRGSWLQAPMKIFIVVMLLLFAALNATQGLWTAAVIFVPVATLVLFSSRFERWRTRRAFRKSPFHDDDITKEFSEADVYISSPKQKVTEQWSAFTEVVHFKDGFLLFHGPDSFDWMPVSAFEKPSDVVQFKELLEAKIARHKIVEPLVPQTQAPPMAAAK